MNGNFELRTPRDRDGTFFPQLIKKHQTTLNYEIEQKIIALYGLGMSYKDISSHIEEMYGIEVLTGTLSAVTDKIIHTVKEWQAGLCNPCIPSSGSMPFTIRSGRTGRSSARQCIRSSA